MGGLGITPRALRQMGESEGLVLKPNPLSNHVTQTLSNTCPTLANLKGCLAHLPMTHHQRVQSKRSACLYGVYGVALDYQAHYFGHPTLFNCFKVKYICIFLFFFSSALDGLSHAFAIWLWTNYCLTMNALQTPYMWSNYWHPVL